MDRVCDQHFHSGTAAPLWDRYNIDWVPTLNLGHGKSATQRGQNAGREARAERSKERRKRQVEQQEQEHLLKQQKLNEPGIPLADFASEIESSSTPGSEQVHDETVHYVMSKKHITQAPHKQRLLIIYIGPWNLGLSRTAHEMMPQLKQKSLTACLLNQQRASPLIKIILEKITGKCHFTQVCQHTKYWKPLSIMFHPLSNDEHNLLLYFNKWSWFL